MPKRPATPCSQPRCPNLKPCPTHPASAPFRTERTQGRNTTDRGYGAEWRRTRAHVLQHDTICRICLKAPATEVDHIVPKSRGGTDSILNLRGVCGPCHRRKTASEDSKVPA